MCTAHWRQLPRAIQRAINAGFRNARNAHELLQNLQYVNACAQAIEYLVEREGRPPVVNAYRRLADKLWSRHRAENEASAAEAASRKCPAQASKPLPNRSKSLSGATGAAQGLEAANP